MAEDPRAASARENGKLGGRPQSEATIRTQLAREMISKALQDSLPMIIAKAIVQASEGDDKARQWLSDRAWGKPIQAISATDDDGNAVPLAIISYGDNHKPTLPAEVVPAAAA